jgi:molecular chaperone DnaJ
VDLYALLGVTRVASAADIERAYRRLARRYHPGLNPGDRAAEEMFRRVQDAFEILSDLERRRDYDRGSNRGGVGGDAEVAVSFEGFDFSSAAEGPLAATFTELFADVFQDAAREATTPTRGTDLEMTAAVSFRDAVLGAAVPLSITRHDRCTVCGGDGRVPRPPVLCPVCAGSGSRRWVRGHLVFTGACEACAGSGRLDVQPCRSCQGIGVQARSEVVTLELRPGTADGDRIAVPGRGNAGSRGGPAGDLYINIAVSQHPFFRRAGRDLELTLPVAVHEVALGARVDVPTLTDTVRLRIPPGTPSGRKLRLRGYGIPAGHGADEAGDLNVELQIVLPAVRDERSKELLREFGRLNDTNVRGHLFGDSRSSRIAEDNAEGS